MLMLRLRSITQTPVKFGRVPAAAPKVKARTMQAVVDLQTVDVIGSLVLVLISKWLAADSHVTSGCRKAKGPTTLSAADLRSDSQLEDIDYPGIKSSSVGLRIVYANDISSQGLFRKANTN